MAFEHFPTGIVCRDFFIKPLQGSKFRRFISVILGNSRANELSPPRIVLGPKDGRRSEDIGGIVNFLGGTHVHARKVKIQGHIEIIGGVARSCTG